MQKEPDFNYTNFNIKQQYLNLKELLSATGGC